MAIRLFLVIAAVLLAQFSFAQSTITIDPSKTLHQISPYLTAACLEDVNHEIYGGLYSQMIFGESFQEPVDASGVSGMWKAFRSANAAGEFSLNNSNPFFPSRNCQTLTLASGQIGIENRGLNRQGISLLAAHLYQGQFWAHAKQNTTARVSFSSADGTTNYAATDLVISSPDWQRYDFTLTPSTTDPAARFNFAVITSGSIDIAYIFVQPGPWGTFKTFPVRADVANALIDQGITALRYGGSMVNNPDYRWKNMIGPRDRRPPYAGHWYPYSTNSFGIVDFLNFCEAAGFMAVPDFCIDESPQDMLDFLEYANGPITTPWGARRAADGHPAPYNLTHLELGNEERVDQTYFNKFQAIARAIWSKDPNIVITVGDFTYNKPILDPNHIEGADSHITDLSAHKQILALAKHFNAEVWFDIHVWTDDLNPHGSVVSFPSYVDAIDKLAEGAKHHVVIFELNANNHAQRRALANAQILMHIMHDGRIPFVSSANCLQVDHQNDNSWDQGLLFLNPTRVWLQPPGYVLQMFSQNHEPNLISCTQDNASSPLITIATAAVDRSTVVLFALNPTAALIPANLRLDPFDTRNASVTVQTLAGDLQATNSANAPDAVCPVTQHVPSSPEMKYSFAPDSFTVVRWTINQRQ
jgi:Alpha-L-arabinofuranosidase C-terminal domain/Carbohydrate binding domain